MEPIEIEAGDLVCLRGIDHDCDGEALPQMVVGAIEGPEAVVYWWFRGQLHKKKVYLGALQILGAFEVASGGQAEVQDLGRSPIPSGVCMAMGHVYPSPAFDAAVTQGPRDLQALKDRLASSGKLKG